MHCLDASLVCSIPSQNYPKLFRFASVIALFHIVRFAFLRFRLVSHVEEILEPILVRSLFEQGTSPYEMINLTGQLASYVPMMVLLKTLTAVSSFSSTESL